MKKKIASLLGALMLATVVLAGATATQVATAPSAEAAWKYTNCYYQTVSVRSTVSYDRTERWLFCKRQHDLWARNVLRYEDTWHYQKKGHPSYLSGFDYYGKSRPPLTLQLRVSLWI